MAVAAALVDQVAVIVLVAVAVAVAVAAAGVLIDPRWAGCSAVSDAEAEGLLLVKDSVQAMAAVVVVVVA